MNISNSRKEHFLINNTLQFIKLLPKQKHVLFTKKYNTNIENHILFSLFDKINRLDINAGVLNHNQEWLHPDFIYRDKTHDHD